jgi:hypothetical protein
MPLKTSDRFAYWLERFEWLHPALLRYDGVAPGGRSRFENRLNRHVVVK